MGAVERIRNLTRPYWPRILGGIAFGLLVSGITAAIAWAVKPALDEVLVGKKYEYLTFLPLGIVVLFSAKGFFSFCQAYLMRSSAMKLVRETRNTLYHHILRLPIGYFHKESSGVIISRIINDVESLNSLVSDFLKTFIVEIPTVVFLLGVAFYRRWDLTLLSLLLLPFIAYSTRKFGKSVKKKRKETQRKLSFLTQRIGETIFGARIIKVFNREETMQEKFQDDNKKYYREFMRVVRLKEFTRLVIDVATGLGIAGVLWYGSVLIIQGSMTAGVFASVLVAIYMMFSPVKKIGEAYTGIQEARASIERIDTLLMEEHEEQGEISVERFRESIRFDHVSFSFPGTATQVLREVNLEIRAGEVIAIVGRSGVGKSTLVDLIPKFHLPTNGKIMIDGTDIRKITLHSLRHLIGIVSQDIILFNDSIRENIGFGNPGASEQEIFEAARMAYADEFIRELPEQYNTTIGDRGLKLSGGQRQRIAIARAILKNSPILILDEATSSLDSVSEALVQKALDELMKGRTTIVIAHRLSTVKNADRILIVEQGSIVDAGRHEELISKNSTYRALYHAFS